MTNDNSEKEYDFSATLVFLVEGKKIWLAPKKAKIGKKRLNGYGGGVEKEDMSVRACAVREVWQEARVQVEASDLELCCIGYFTNIKDDGSVFVCKVWIYLARNWSGFPRATKEMGKPKSFNVYNIPYGKMMAADQYWLPEMLKGRKIIVRATLKNKQSELVGNVKISDEELLE